VKRVSPLYVARGEWSKFIFLIFHTLFSFSFPACVYAVAAIRLLMAIHEENPKDKNVREEKKEEKSFDVT
jgi:2-methylcitrate dehydratase PrpD